MKKKLAIILSILTIIYILMYIFVNSYDDNVAKNVTNSEESVVEVIENEDIEDINEILTEYTNLYQEGNKYNNSDYIGYLVFESNLISEPIVLPQNDLNSYLFYKNDGKIVTDLSNCESGTCSLNDVYLRTDYKDMSYNLGGTCFMDYRNNLNDQNLIIYGHHFPTYLDEERKLYFTPLESLMNQENYKENNVVYLVLESEIRKYEIAYVYIYNYLSSNSNELEFYRTNYEYDYNGNFDEGYYQKYINSLEDNKLYDTGIKLNTNDKTLTLQTCMENEYNLYEIIVLRYVETLNN